eukprot:scaffold75_cov217-Pinguiococcus_pyrenoidosus.AAC.17
MAQSPALRRFSGAFKRFFTAIAPRMAKYAHVSAPLRPQGTHVSVRRNHVTHTTRAKFCTSLWRVPTSRSASPEMRRPTLIADAITKKVTVRITSARIKFLSFVFILNARRGV